MKVCEIMTAKVKTAPPEASIADVARLMVLNRISGIPVVDNGILMGIVSEKDVLRSIYPSYQEFIESAASTRNLEEMEERYQDVTRMKAKTIMTKAVATVSPDTPILKAASLMIRKKVRRLPVVDDQERVVGIVTQGDVHLAVFERQFADQRVP